MRVPNFQQQVGQNQTPSARLQGGLGAGQAGQMAESMYGGIADAAKSAGDAYLQYRDEQDRVRAMDGVNQAAELRMRLEMDKTDGFGNKRGADAVNLDDGSGTGFVGYFEKAYQDGLAEISGRLSNPRQKQMFDSYVAQTAPQFKARLQNYFVRENDTYQLSVLSASADRSVMQMNEAPADFTKVDNGRNELRTSLMQQAKLSGKSAQEAEMGYLKLAEQAHKTNVETLLEFGNLQGALAYKQQYGDEISLNTQTALDQKIVQIAQNQEVERLVQRATGGTSANSNPALNLPPVAVKASDELRQMPIDQLKNIKYNDQRLDSYTVKVGADKNMQWATPLILGLRLAGEKSNNNQVSPKGAKSVMQFMPATWGDFNKGGQRDINNPADTIEAAYEFVDWISKKYNTRDPMVIAAYYNGGGRAAEAVLNGRQPPAGETRKYLDHMDGWFSKGMADYAASPSRAREAALAQIQNSNASPEVKQKALASVERQFKAQDDIKEARQNEQYDSAYKNIMLGAVSFEQLPYSQVQDLKPNQLASLEAISKQKFTDVKTDPIKLSMITLNAQELFKGKPQSVLHQYADSLSPADYKAVTKMYMDVNNPKTNKPDSKDKTYLVNDATALTALKPWLPQLGVSNTKDANQLTHLNAIKLDVMQTLREAEARKGSALTWNEIDRVVLKNVGTKYTAKYSSLIGKGRTEQERVYDVRTLDDIPAKTLDKIKQRFKAQGRDPNKVTNSEYLNAFYTMARRGDF